MQVRAPRCFECKHFKGRPVGAKDKARCAVKARGIPDSIYFDGKKCNQFSPKSK